MRHSDTCAVPMCIRIRAKLRMSKHMCAPQDVSWRRSVLQCVAVCCSVLQCVAVCCSVLQCVAACRS